MLHDADDEEVVPRALRQLAAPLATPSWLPSRSPRPAAAPACTPPARDESSPQADHPSSSCAESGRADWLRPGGAGRGAVAWAAAARTDLVALAQATHHRRNHGVQARTAHPLAQPQRTTTRVNRIYYNNAYMIIIAARSQPAPVGVAPAAEATTAGGVWAAGSRPEEQGALPCGAGWGGARARGVGHQR